MIPIGPFTENVNREAAFITTRPRLFAIAYRYLGDAGEAEDVVQETWLRWERADRSAIVNAPAFLAKTTVRLSLNVVQSARMRRETFPGPWLAERNDDSAGPDSAAEQHEAVDLAVRVLLEKLSPAERAAYLLRKAFDYPYRRISEVLHLDAAYARQLVRRARERIETGRRRPVDITEYQRLVQVFLDATRTGDLAELEVFLAADITMRRSA
ncbi:sigma-70 family RNA polymerase sigma factor [Nonomuraea sp. SBT364]|uniref:sigma-70 family RNA polymerase sigma factor n=1 Tax=Nonomuraea sp. SBT364 TaxID=1580530 RepID=UPI00069D1009|nr:sigma-70 family RNA polymerase sigma factor [Nonomuraea sp. SBT364]